MQMIQRRKGVKKTVRIVFVAVGLGHVIYNFFTVFDDMTVTVDDRVPFKGHSSILLGYLTISLLRTALLSRRAYRKGCLVFGLANGSKLRTADLRLQQRCITIRYCRTISRRSSRRYNIPSA